MARRPVTHAENNRQVLASNQVQHKKRPPLLRYRKKVPEPQSPVASNNQLDETDDILSPDNQHSHKSSPVKIHPIPSSSKVYVVNVQDFRFHPEHIVVEQHSTIRWQIPASSKTVYSITICSTKTTDSPIISHDNPTFEHKFDTLGDFSYFCSLYSFMNGSISVVPSLSTEERSRNMFFLDYKLPKTRLKLSPKSTSLPVIPFQKQLVVWREKQPPSIKCEDDDVFARKTREHIKKKSQKKSRSPRQSVPIQDTQPSTCTDTSSSDDILLECIPTTESTIHEIRLQEFEFSAVVAPFKVGDTISWVVSPENPGMVEHALQFKAVHASGIAHTFTSPPLKPGDRWNCRVLQPCTISVECVVYHIKCEIVVHSTPVILIGDVPCPVDSHSPTINDEAIADEPTILQLLEKSQLRQKANRTSYLLKNQDGSIPGFDAASAYDFLKQRAIEVKQLPSVVYASSRHV